MKRKSKLAICFIAYIFINFSIGCSGNSKIQPMPTPTPIPMLLQTLSSTPIPADIPVVKRPLPLLLRPNLGQIILLHLPVSVVYIFLFLFLILKTGVLRIYLIMVSVQ